MWVLILVFGVAGLYNTEAIQSFSKHSNNNPEYRFVRAVPCETGLKSTGYSVAPTGRLFLKQVNKDGSVGVVCSE
jgi:hypothetical protein